MASEAAFHPRVKAPGRFFIDGQWSKPSGDGHRSVVSAHSGEAYAHVAEAQAADIEHAVAAARKAFDHGIWPRLSHRERAGYLQQIAAKLVERSADIGHGQTNQMGILSSASVFGARAAAGIFAEYAAMAETFQFLERHTPSMGGGVGLIAYEPVGVVAAIIPWNAPAMLAALKMAPALLAGCTVVLKASPEAPTELLILAEICEEVGLPAGVVNVLTADREVSELLVRHPGVDKVSFTGSSAAGRKIAAICGERIARCTLELGGKSAAVILDDYDMDAAAKALSGSLIFMNGQVCAALTRVVVPRKRQAEFTEAMRAAFGSVKVGDPFDPATQLGPLATERQRERVEGYISRGKADGATLAVGGGRPAHLNRGWFVEPTLFTDVDPNAVIAQEEIFGPVAAVIPADDEAQAVAIANNSMFGLNSAVFTKDIDAAWMVGRQLRAGTVGHNGFKTDFRMGFGGFKQSGIGREGGVNGLRAYLEPKTMLMDADAAWADAL